MITACRDHASEIGHFAVQVSGFFLIEKYEVTHPRMHQNKHLEEESFLNILQHVVYFKVEFTSRYSLKTLHQRLNNVKAKKSPHQIIFGNRSRLQKRFDPTVKYIFGQRHHQGTGLRTLTNSKCLPCLPRGKSLLESVTTVNTLMNIQNYR